MPGGTEERLSRGKLSRDEVESFFDNTETLALFLFFLLPGFVSLKVFDSLVPSERRDFSKSIFEVIAYSALNYAVLFPAVFWILTKGKDAYPILAWTCTIFAVVLMPGTWPFLWIRILKSKVFSRHFSHPTQKPWDFVFGQRKPYWAIVHLRDLRKIAGVYGDRSFASSNPCPPEIYLEEVWKLDDNGRFERAIYDSEGILILESEILAIEFFRYDSRGLGHGGHQKSDQHS